MLFRTRVHSRAALRTYLEFITLETAALKILFAGLFRVEGVVTGKANCLLTFGTDKNFFLKILSNSHTKTIWPGTISFQWITFLDEDFLLELKLHVQDILIVDKNQVELLVSGL